MPHLEPWEPRDAVLAGVPRAPFLPRLPVDAWQALGSWRPREAADELVAFRTLTVPSVTCSVREAGKLVIAREACALQGAEVQGQDPGREGGIVTPSVWPRRGSGRPLLVAGASQGTEDGGQGDSQGGVLCSPPR